MFGRSTSEEEPQPAPAPRRRETRDADFFKPSTFAGRKAARLARGEPEHKPQRLVSLGMTEQVLDGFGTKGSRRYQPPRRVRAELLVDIDHTSKVYVRQEGSTTLEPIIRVVHEGDTKEPIGTIPTRPPGPVNFAPAAPDRRTPVE